MSRVSDGSKRRYEALAGLASGTSTMSMPAHEVIVGSFGSPPKTVPADEFE